MFVEVTVDHLSKIFETIPDSTSALEHLSLGDNSGISRVNPELLAKGVNNLKYFDFVNFDSGKFSETKTKEIFKVMSQGTKLKMLGIPSNNMQLEWIDHINTVDPYKPHYSYIDEILSTIQKRATFHSIVLQEQLLCWHSHNT